MRTFYNCYFLDSSTLSIPSKLVSEYFNLRLNKGHFGDNINSTDLFFVQRLSSSGGSKYIVGIILEPQVVSFIERFITLCMSLFGRVHYQRFHCSICTQ